MEHNDKKWLEKYEIAKSYYLEFGNLLVPDKFNYKGINLGNWIYIQRHSYKEKKLNQNRIRLLSEINMIWDALPDFDEMWEKSFTLASDFKNEFGTIIIPINFVYKNYSIGKWISHQRQRYVGRKNPLTNEQIKKLESIGMIWDAYNDQWDNSFDIALNYFNKNCNLNVSTTCIFNNFNLGNWISAQRNMYKNHKLSKEKIKKLESIGMVWDASVDIEKIWDNYYSIAKDYYLEHKNLNIKIREKYKGINLGSWINKIRNEHDKLSDEQIDNLNKIGMIWNVHKDKWDANYNLLLDYYKANNNILIPFDYIYKNVKLGQWLKRQMISKNKLTPKQVKLLDNLGIVWKRNSNKWDEMFDLAKKYYLEHKNLLVDTHSKYKGQNLGYWINHQRDDYKKRNTDNANVDFSLDRIHKLESIGMVWDVNDYLWNKNYEILSEYYSLNGDVDIPSSLEYKNIKLGKWLQNQKSSYKGYKGRKKLTEEQIIKLEKLNIKFK